MCKDLAKVIKYLFSGCYSVCFLSAFDTGGMHAAVSGPVISVGVEPVRVSVKPLLAERLLKASAR